MRTYDIDAVLLQASGLRRSLGGSAHARPPRASNRREKLDVVKRRPPRVPGSFCLEGLPKDEI